MVAIAASMFGALDAQSAPAPQPPPKVILIRPPAAPAAVTEALVRLRGELIAAGFDAQVTELTLGADVRASLEKLAPPSDTAATALVAVVASDPGSADLWVIDRVTGKTVVRKVNAGGADAPRVAEVLAVRAVELLRASFLELAIATPPSSEAPPPPPPVVERFATATLEEADWTWAVEAGGATADAIGGPWNAVLSVARIEHAFGRRLCARITFAGLGTAAHVDTPGGGYVGLSQTVLLAEGLVRFRRGRRIEPILSLGAGALRLAADSHESAPYAAVSSARWAAAGDAGVGLRLPLRRHRFELGVELHALLAQPYPSVRFFGNEVAQAGRPSLIGSVTLLGGI